MSLAQQVLGELQYLDSPNFLRPGRRNTFEDAADFSHIFRRARDHCHLHGVYSLRQSETKGRDTIVPVVYVCEATDEQDAERIHRLVWNQNVVPFLLVISPKSIRLYPGFRYEAPQPEADPAQSGVLRAASNFNTALEFLDSFRSARIDDGTVFERWGHEVTPQTRVDWKLLSSLNDLDEWLRNNGIDDPHVSHALIGKYVYLQYLRHRDILSDRRLAEWGLEKEQIFGRSAHASAFWKVVEKLNEWLNGSVFPLKSSGAGRPTQKHIRKVAGTFEGDDPASGQQSLNFDAFDFSFIPIETLSVIYEQFLHAPDGKGNRSRGRSQGAYYTPIALVNFMLEELDTLHPLVDGMRVLDPACGSGAFLVQCYRRIVERDEEFRPGKPMRPARLRDLLVQHIFGIDRDSDACRVAELSLSLTLLDYVDPPDLMRPRRFRLPDLHGTNIFHGDFFDEDANWRDSLSVERFDWIVGNPPWVELKRSNIAQDDQFVWQWMQDAENQHQRPIGGHQVAEAFAWEVTEHLDEEGCTALLLPAMTLFKDESRNFRQQFFSSVCVHAVANFANLADVLFPGHRYRLGGRKEIVSRPRRPAAAFFYAHKDAQKRARSVSVFSPLVADQPANCPTRPGRRKDTWNIVVDASKIHSVKASQASTGNALPWKMAMWGSHLDIRLLNSVDSHLPSFQEFCRLHDLTVSQGLELRLKSATEPIEPLPDVEHKVELKTVEFRNRGLIFEFPPNALQKISSERCFVRRGRRRLPLAICKPPHIILDKLRRFAVYSDEFVVVPPRQIGIAGDESNSRLLKALSLYLVSDFAIYHQFMLSPEWGISTSISTLDTLRALPVPLSKMKDSDLNEWSDLHSRIIEAARHSSDGQRKLLDEEPESPDNLSYVLEELNGAVFDLLQLNYDERVLVTDLVHLRMQLVKGKVTSGTVRDASKDELCQYGKMLQTELDAFVDDQPEMRHAVSIVQNGKSGIVSVTLNENAQRYKLLRVETANSALAKELGDIYKRIDNDNSQWIYFRRNLRLYEGRTTYIVKPLQRLHWTESQALLDAGSIIAETLT